MADINKPTDSTFNSVSNKLDNKKKSSIAGIQLTTNDDPEITLAPPTIQNVGDSSADMTALEQRISKSFIFRSKSFKGLVSTIDAGAKLRRDVVPNLARYMSVRKLLASQIDRIGSVDATKTTSVKEAITGTADESSEADNASPVEETPERKFPKINADVIIAERLAATRHAELMGARSIQQNTLDNLLKFNTSVVSKFMAQSLTLQYRQTFLAKDQLELTRAFATTVENKLEAIKINTGIPDSKKKSLIRLIGEGLTRSAVTQTTSAITKPLAEKIADVVNTKITNPLMAKGADLLQSRTVTGVIDTAADVIERKRTIRSVYDNIKQHDYVTKARELLGDRADLTNMVRDRLTPESLLAAKDTIGAKIGGLRNKLATSLRTSIQPMGSGAPVVPPVTPNTPVVVPPTQTAPIVPPTMSGLAAPPPVQPSVNSTVQTQMISDPAIVSEVRSFHDSFNTWVQGYDRNHHEIIDTLGSIGTRGDNTTGGNGGGDRPRRRGILSGLFGRRRQSSPDRAIFIDIYRRDAVEPGSPLVSKEQLESGLFTTDGRRIRSLKDIVKPIIDPTTGRVVVSREDIQAGLVDVNNKLINKPKSSMFKVAGSVIKSTAGVYIAAAKAAAGAVGMVGKGVVGIGNALIERRSLRKFTDVYRKDSLTIGYPLVSEKQLKDGLVLADGTPIRNVNQINKPVIDPNTQTILISEDDLKAGLVDSNNKPLKGQSVLGGIAVGLGKAVGATLGAYGGYVKFTGALAVTGAKFLLKKRGMEPFVDVYRKDNIKPGHPLVSIRRLKDGLTLASGRPITNVNQITEPVLDPKTGETIITEEDLKAGLTDVFGSDISSRKSSMSILGAGLNLAKFGISKAAGLAGGMLGLYKDMFGLGLKGMGGAGKVIMRALGFGDDGGGRRGGLNKKDLQEMITDHLEDIYELLDARLPEPSAERAGGYADLVKKKASKLAKIAGKLTGGKGGLLSRLAGLGAVGAAGAAAGGQDDSSGGLLGDVGNTLAGTYLGSKLGAAKSFIGSKLGGLKGAVGSLFGRGAAAAGTGLATGGARALAGTVGKSLLKKIPLIGIGAGLGFAAKRAWSGDFTGAAGEVASGVVGQIPIIGTAASAGIDVALAKRDSDKENEAAQATQQPTISISTKDGSMQRFIAWLKSQSDKDAVSMGNRLEIAIIKGSISSVWKDVSSEKKFKSFYIAFTKSEAIRASMATNPNAAGAVITQPEQPGLVTPPPTPTDTPTTDIIKASTSDVPVPTVPNKADIHPQTGAVSGQLKFEPGSTTRGVSERVRGATISKQIYTPGGGPATSDNKVLVYKPRGSKEPSLDTTIPESKPDMGESTPPPGVTPPEMPGMKPPSNDNTVPTKPTFTDLGSLSAKHESGKRGSSAVGYDRVGGTSYGKYQIASANGTFTEYLKFLRKQEGGAEIADRLERAGEANSGSKDGAVAKEWQNIVSEGKMGDFEHQFIKSTKYDAALNKLSPEMQARVNESPALQQVLWSTAVQHGQGGAAKIFNNVAKEGGDDKAIISGIYRARSTKFGSSSEQVRNSVLNRFDDEQKQALAMAGTKTTPDVLTASNVESTPNKTAMVTPAVDVMPRGAVTTPTNNAPISIASSMVNTPANAIAPLTIAANRERPPIQNDRQQPSTISIPPELTQASATQADLAKLSHGTLNEVLGSLSQLNKSMQGALGNEGVFASMHNTMRQNGSPTINMPVVNATNNAQQNSACQDVTGIDVSKKRAARYRM